MLPIKIHCGCGQKYAFDVEPVDGQMGCGVQCPVCGIDGTTAANQLIAQYLIVQPAAGLGIRISAPKPAVPIPPPVSGSFADAVRAGNFSRAKVRNKWVMPVAGGAVVLVLAGIVLYVRSPGLRYKPASPAVVINDGLPHALEELNAWYVEPPSGQNAATFYAQGFDALQLGNAASSNLPFLGQGKPPSPGVPLAASVKSAMTALIHSNQDALRFFIEGSHHQQCRYPLDLSRGFETAFPHLPKIKNAMPLLELSAVAHAEAREGKPAATDVLTALALARSLEMEPALISQTRRMAAAAVAIAALEETVNRAALPRESLGELAQALQKMEACDARGEGFNRALTAERLASLTLLETPQKLIQLLALPGVDILEAERNQIAERARQAGERAEEQHYLEESFRQLMTARQAAFPDRLKADALVRQRLAEATNKTLLINGYLMSGLSGEAAREAAGLARSRLGLTAVALELFRFAHENHYPTGLSALTPDYLAATPLDPFDGQPLRYQKKDGGYALYSIGPDLADNSGDRLNGKDIVFAVSTAPKQEK